MPAWDAVKQADRDHTDALATLETAQAATRTAEQALSDAQGTYDEAKNAERLAEDQAEVAQAHLIQVSEEVGIDYPPENSGAPPVVARKRAR